MRATAQAALVRQTRMKYLLATLLVLTSLSAAQDTRTFTGTISDETCAERGHAQMRMGPTDAECTTACILAHGDRYVLDDGNRVYILSDQKTPERFAAQTVRVTGALDTRTMTIHVESITAAR